MPGQFLSPTGEDLQRIYVDDYNLIDQYAATGSLWLWGYNTQGVLGDGSSIVHRSSPIQTVSGGTNWRLVSCGAYHNLAIKTDGTLWTWGNNNSGQLGDGASITNRSSPIQTVSGGTNWKQVAGGFEYSAAIKTNGALWLWGNNNFGQLGNNASGTNQSSPVQTVAAGTNWKLVACGRYHTTAIKTDGTLWTWGGAGTPFNVGQLGDNTTVNKSSPVQTIAGGTNWKLVACGNFHTTAIKTDGTLWLWGENQWGHLGDNTLTKKSSPIQTVSGGTNWRQVAGNSANTMGIKTDGTLWLWGQNAYGVLGDNTAVNKSSPVQTIAGGTNWKQVAGSNLQVTAIKTDGTLWTWGRNDTGQLGVNNIVHRSSPIQTVAGGTNWKLIGSGGGGSVTAIYFYDAGNLYPNS